MFFKFWYLLGLQIFIFYSIKHICPPPPIHSIGILLLKSRLRICFRLSILAMQPDAIYNISKFSFFYRYLTIIIFPIVGTSNMNFNGIIFFARHSPNLPARIAIC
jgi:hypothetical protein